MATSSLADTRDGILSTSAQGASFLILLQLASRALTFLVNQLLLRYLSPELLAISSQLELYLISVLFFARESLRVALQRQPVSSAVPVEDTNRHGSSQRKRTAKTGAIEASSAAGAAQTVVNLSYIAIWLGLALALALGKLYLGSTTPDVLATPFFRQGLQLYGIAAFWELLTEPCFVIVQQQMRYKTRAAAEAAATLIRCLVTCGVAVVATRRGIDVGVLPFAAGQLAYAGALLVVYYWNIWSVAKHDGFSLSARPLISDPPSYMLDYFSRPLLNLSVTLTLQSTLKHLLTQGDTLLLAALTPLHDQGIYALASAYGSLAARILFQPIEESSRNLFATMLSSSSGLSSSSSLPTALTLLTTLLHLYGLLTLIFTAVGPPLAPLLLSLVAGPRWAGSGAGPVLADYCYYLPLLAVNGICEAFVSAVATTTELHAQSAAMLAFSAGFAVAGWLFLRFLAWGARGLVAANAVNMALRIAWSGAFIRRYVRGKEQGGLDVFGGVMPRAGSIASAVATGAVLRRLASVLDGGLRDWASMLGVSGVFGLLIIYFERDYLTHCYQLLRPQPLQDVKTGDVNAGRHSDGEKHDS
ncbi:MAG: hypothetical protein M1825_003868 [Sarcosagium campestre]|nr:MAG: hypothetical protein M1825_003868 [Sarcosagium campestre]